MPNSWTFTSLGDVAHVDMGQSPPSEYVTERGGHGLPFLQGNAEFTDLHPQPRLWCGKPAKTALTGDSLISVRAPVGAINRADQDYCIGRGLAAIRFGSVNADFGYQALDLYSEELRRVAQGTTFEAVGGHELRGLRFPLAPAPEQRRIAEILDTLDQAIRKTEQVIAKLQQMKQGLLHDLLTRGIDENGELRDPDRHPEQFKDSPLGRIPSEWKIHRVGDLFSMQLGKMLSKQASAGPNQKPYLANRHVQWNHVALCELETMSFSLAEREKFNLVSGDLLVCEGGEVGRSALWRGESADVYFQKAIHRLRATDNSMLPGFMLRFMRFAAECGMFADLSSQTSIAHLTQEKLALLKVPRPPTSEQTRIVQVFDSSDEKESKEKEQLEKLRTLKHGLMDDLLTGRVRVPAHEEANQ